MLAYICLLGTGTGVQLYILIGAALAMLYSGSEHIALGIAFGAVAAALIVAVLLAVPYDTEVLPQWLMTASLATNVFVSSGILLLIVSYAQNQAEQEYERSERLLTNILPGPIAARLKRASNVVVADRHDEASILFADMAGFTVRASDTPAEELVQFLNRVFSDFDRLVEQHGSRKSRPQATPIWS
jgi:adenylate cyclase